VRRTMAFVSSWPNSSLAWRASPKAPFSVISSNASGTPTLGDSMMLLYGNDVERILPASNASPRTMSGCSVSPIDVSTSQACPQCSVCAPSRMRSSTMVK
jgi:hypothetical protein